MTARWSDKLDARSVGGSVAERLRGRAPVDAYGLWADLTEFADLGGPPKRMPMLLELADEEGIVAKFIEGLGHQSGVEVPSIYRRPPHGTRRSRRITALLSPAAYREPPDAWGRMVTRFELGLPIIPMVDERDLNPFPLGGRAIRPPVLVGIIDDGIAFAHERFREPAARGTRFEFFWDQNEPAPGAPPLPPPLLGYGRAFEKTDIDGWMAAALYAGDVHEEQVYRRAAYSGVRRQLTHGTHIADLAAGADPNAAGPAPPRIAGVQLPYGVVATGNALGTHVLDALQYLLLCSDAIAHRLDADRPAPLVVNLSYSRHAGPHDGQSIFERAVDDLIKLRRLVAPFSVVLPAGNHYLARGHFAGSVAPAGSEELRWRVLPDDRTPSFLEIWLDDDATGVAVTVTPPNLPASPPIVRGQGVVLMSNGRVLCALLYPNFNTQSSKQLVYVALAPTVAGAPRVPAPCGEWRIGIANGSTDSLRVQAWVERDDTVMGYPIRGRQSWLDDDNYLRFDGAGRTLTTDQAGSKVQRRGSFNGFATGTEPPVVGASMADDDDTSRYSGGGIQPVLAMQPTALMTADESPVRLGMIAAKTRSGARAAVSGTSVSAGHLTRWTAGCMAAASAYDRAAIATFASTFGSPAKEPPERGGAGTIDAATPASARR